MQPGEIAFLCLAVGAITTFGGVLAWASWMEWRAAKKQTQRQPSADHHGMAAPAHRAF